MTPQCEYFVSQFDQPGYALDVGANDGLFLSNTFELEHLGLWQVLCIEANPLHGPALWANRKESVIGAVGSKAGYEDFTIYGEPGEHQGSYSALKPVLGEEGSSTKVRVQTLDWYLGKWAPPRLDILCMDIEGGEMDALQGFDLLRWSPKVICIESLGGDSTKAFGDLFSPQYKHVITFGYDLIFKRLDQ